MIIPLHEPKREVVKQISDINGSANERKKKKKSFWFEYAEEKGLNPHKSAWAEFDEQEKRRQTNEEMKFCDQCGASLKIDSRFCQRCGSKIKRIY